jgi:methionyl-tRNA formyltransferase
MNDKVIIDWIEFDDNGFDINIPNGTIVSINPIRVKTPNGLVKITKMRNSINKISLNTKFENK